MFDREAFYVLGAVISFIIIVLLLAMIPIYYSACQQAKIYNSLHQTSYTCSDFFWAGEQINAGSYTIKK